MPEPRHNKGDSKQDYVTPWPFILAVRGLLNIDDFDIDLAASVRNTRVREHFYTKEDNALIQPWKVGEGWNWLNPEFALISPWVAKAYSQLKTHGAQTAVLVPAGVGSNWFRDWVFGKAYCLFLNGRITFEGAVTCYPKDCILLLYGMPPGFDVWTWPNDVPNYVKV